MTCLFQTKDKSEEIGRELVPSERLREFAQVWDSVKLHLRGQVL